MKYLLIVIVTMLTIGCNPYGVLNEVTKGGITNKLVDVITTDVIIRTIDDSTKIEEIRVVSIPTLMLNNYLDGAESWLGEFRYGNGGYACLCAFFETTKVKDAVIFHFLAKSIGGNGFDWGTMKVPVSDEDWNDIAYMFPSEVVRNTDVFVTFKK